MEPGLKDLPPFPHPANTVCYGGGNDMTSDTLTRCIAEVCKSRQINDRAVLFTAPIAVPVWVVYWR